MPEEEWGGGYPNGVYPPRWPTTVMPSSNFKDPVGVVLRMLRSTNRAAQSALARELARVLLLPVDLIAGPFERRRIGRTTASDSPVLLVVGAPRSGTSLVQQLLVTHLQANFIPNGAGLLPRAPMLGARLFGKGGRVAPRDYLSYLGQTRSLRGPNDAFFLWDRWFGDARGHLGAAISPEALDAMRHTLNVWMHTFGAPLINKNNRNTICMPAIAQALPQARFLVVRREPVDVALSLFKARAEVQGDSRVAWGLLARDAPREANDHEVLQAICEQLHEVESVLRASMEQLDPSRFRCVSLKHVCAEPAEFVASVSNWMPAFKMLPERLSELRPLEYRQPEAATPHRELLQQWLAPIATGTN